MVNPLYLIALYLIAAFLVSLFFRLNRYLGLGLMYLSIAAVLGASIFRIWELLLVGVSGREVFTAGFYSSLSIVLQFGITEAVGLALISICGLLGAVFLFQNFQRLGAYPLALYLMVLLGASGMVLTRDIFNSFVFLEILSISTTALIGLKQGKNALAAGLKYMLAGGIASSLMLIGIIFVYRYTGTLNIDTWLAYSVNGAMGSTTASIQLGSGYKVALYLIAISIFIELKPYPANGWALDLYNSVHSGLGAIIATVNVTAQAFLFYKLIPLFGNDMLLLFAGAGLFSYVMSNLVALRQKNVKRLLGYSGAAQSGLIIFVLCALHYMKLPAQSYLLIAGGILATNIFAKSGLFWLTGILKEEEISAWKVLGKHPGLLILFGVFVVALTGFPPFPVFFAKYALVHIFANTGHWFWLSFLLIGSFLEAVYLLRWLSLSIDKEAMTMTLVGIRPNLIFATVFSLIALGFMAFYGGRIYFGLSDHVLYPLIGAALFMLLDFLPAKLKGAIAIITLGAWGYLKVYPDLPLLGQVFAGILVGGAIIQIFAFMRHKGAQDGLFPLLVMLILAMGNLVITASKLEFFVAWEFIALASYLLILRGRKAQYPALNYILFSLFGAFMILIGLALMPEFISGYPIILQAVIFGVSPLAALLVGIGLLIKVAALGLHIWLPSAYAEAEDETTSLLSSVLSKAGVFGMFIFLIMLRNVYTGNDIPMITLGWIGALTAFFGALMAVFQEDAKRLLAYSSMSQLGYVVLGLSLMSHLGWVSALYLTINHLFFKALVFMAIAGVILRTGTRNMYEMGGLIKKMPISFISVLMGIIAISGVPPLSGFGSKWFIYTSLLESGRYLQMGLAFFASAVAFLYLYRLIHTVFLGQAKPEQSSVKEAPFWLIIPQGIFIMLIMAISMFPNLITKLVSAAVGSFISKPEWLNWNGYNLSLSASNLSGNWNGNLVMYVTMAVFGFPLVWLLLVNARTQKVKQFNIVYAAERPYRPGTTHFAFNMFAHYYKALGFWVKPRATAFYMGVSEWTHSIASTLARLYTGNAQTYMLHIFLYTLLMYIILGVKV